MHPVADLQWLTLLNHPVVHYSNRFTHNLRRKQSIRKSADEFNCTRTIRTTE